VAIQTGKTPKRLSEHQPARTIGDLVADCNTALVFAAVHVAVIKSLKARSKRIFGRTATPGARFKGTEIRLRALPSRAVDQRATSRMSAARMARTASSVRPSSSIWSAIKSRRKPVSGVSASNMPASKSDVTLWLSCERLPVALPPPGIRFVERTCPCEINQAQRFLRAHRQRLAQPADFPDFQ